MGAVNKLALTVEGVPLVRRIAQTLLAAGLEEVVAVVGHEAAQVRALLEGLSLTLVENPDYADGQMTSVHAGLAALSRPCDAFMVCLSDQPLLTTDDIAGLVRAFTDRGRASILVPTHGGARGNPVVLAHEHLAAILTGDRSLGCRGFIDRNPELVATVEMDTDHGVFDLDTPEDYERLLERLAGAPAGCRQPEGLTAAGRARVDGAPGLEP